VRVGLGDRPALKQVGVVHGHRGGNDAASHDNRSVTCLRFILWLSTLERSACLRRRALRDCRNHVQLPIAA
jgi:hypothetical protein